MNIPADDIEITFYKSSGPGGQKKNVTESAVRVRHLPTGIVVTASASRSQRRNRDEAMAELVRRLEIRNRPRKPRHKTRPTRASQERRIEGKRHLGAKKRLRRAPGGDD